MRAIDFRARPNTAEYMKMYTGPANARLWERFGYPEPPVVSLAEFVRALAANDIAHAVFTGRQSVSGGEIVRGVSNDYVARCAAESGGRIVGFAGIDPTSGVAALREMERCVRQLGLRGVSLDPHTARSLPSDRGLYPVYEMAAELRIPVTFTMGPLVGRYAEPSAVDQVAEDFPGLTLVCSHGCWPQVTEFIALAYRRDNVYLEASIYEFLPGAEPFLDAANTIIQDRVVYASAFPFNPLETLSRFTRLPFSAAALDKLVYGNASRVLGLDGGA